MKINRTKLLQIAIISKIGATLMILGLNATEAGCQLSIWLWKISLICLAIWFCTEETKEQ